MNGKSASNPWRDLDLPVLPGTSARRGSCLASGAYYRTLDVLT
jgi:hypothetical protein